jgi:hypothetical protein
MPGADAFGKLVNISFVFLALALIVAFGVLHAGRQSEISTVIAHGPTGEAARKTQKPTPGKSSAAAQATLQAALPGHGREDFSKSVLQTRLFKIMSVATIFMVTPYSIYISDLIPKINSVSFAWRWLVIVCFYTALVLTAAIDSLIARAEWKPIKVWGYRAAGGAILLANIWISINPIMLGAFAHRNLNAPQDRREMGYVPKSGAQPAVMPATPNFSFIFGAGRIEAVTWEPLYRAVTLDVNDFSTVRVKTYHFPGWIARIDGRPVEILPDDMGAQLISVPAGNHRLELFFVNTPVRNAGTILSLLAFVGICGLVVLDRVRCVRRIEVQA